MTRIVIEDVGPKRFRVDGWDDKGNRVDTFEVEQNDIIDFTINYSATLRGKPFGDQQWYSQTFRMSLPDGRPYGYWKGLWRAFTSRHRRFSSTNGIDQ
jgi:hypothetical protein